MRVPVEYIALAVSGLSYTSSGAPSIEVASLDATTLTSCWASSNGVPANYGTLDALRIDASEFCNQFSSNSTQVVSTSGKLVFGYQSAIFLGNFASWTSCLNTFNTLVTACYGSANPSRPTTLGGTITDPGGANLVISFGTGAQL